MFGRAVGAAFCATGRSTFAIEAMLLESCRCEVVGFVARGLLGVQVQVRLDIPETVTIHEREQPVCLGFTACHEILRILAS